MIDQIIKLAETETSTATTGNSALSIIISIVPFAILILVFYFFMIRPQKKQERETNEMRNSVERGDVITTIGGIVGIVIIVKDDDILIETSGSKTKMQIKKWAIRSVEQKYDSGETTEESK